MSDKTVSALKEKNLTNWSFNADKNCIEKTVLFKSYLKNIAFVNAVAWLANKENHHPDLEISYDKCIIRLTTHDENGVGEKDFSLASKIDNL
jgi:4a-hydroxytetrahydrobiopterin dehydratase